MAATWCSQLSVPRQPEAGSTAPSCPGLNALGEGFRAEAFVFKEVAKPYLCSGQPFALDGKGRGCHHELHEAWRWLHPALLCLSFPQLQSTVGSLPVSKGKTQIPRTEDRSEPEHIAMLIVQATLPSLPLWTELLVRGLAP